MEPLRIVVLGLSITSSWGNGHATTYRGLVRELGARGHDVLFLERDVPWYASNRDLPQPAGCQTELYQSEEELHDRFADAIREADLVMVGSYLPDGIAIGHWVQEIAEGITAFYDIDTPVTLARVERGECAYLTAEQIPGYDIYLSFTGGPTLHRLQDRYGSPQARALYCSVDPEVYRPMALSAAWDLGYLGTYAEDRQPAVDRLLLEPARRWKNGRFVVAGPMYPDGIDWPPNVTRFDHLPPAEHARFYNSQRATLNATRADMVRLGHSPSVRLFEAAACGTPIISDRWTGLDELFVIGREILVADSPEKVLAVLRTTGDRELRAIGRRGRERILAQHTAAHRAQELEGYIAPLLGQRTVRVPISKTAKPSGRMKPA